jgi:hypothetical protein
MTEPELPLDLPLPASHPLANPPRVTPKERERPTKAGKPPKPLKVPLPFPEKIADQTKQIVRAIIDARDPELTEEWYLALVQDTFETVHADRAAQEAKPVKMAEERAPVKASLPPSPSPPPPPEGKFKWKKTLPPPPPP